MQADESAPFLENPLLAPDWDEFVLAHPEATFFHRRDWIEMLHRSYGYEPMAVSVRRDGRRHASIPVMAVNSPLTGRRGISLPFTDAVEALCADPETFRLLWDFLAATGRDRGWRYVEIRGSDRWLAGEQPSTSFYNHTLRIATDPAVRWSGLDDSVRRAVRKAERNGVDVVFASTPEAMEEFCRLHRLTRRRHGVPPQPISFFREIQRLLARGNGWIALGQAGGATVSAAVYFHSGRKGVYKFGASDESRQDLRANNLVMWRSIERLAAGGCETLDFGRTSLANEGLRRFKRGWGAEEQTRHYFRLDLRAGKFVTAKDDSHGWHTAVFRHLPEALSQAVGSLLYRHIA